MREAQPVIFQYSDAAAFLRDTWKEKRKKNPSFSLRSWARKLGFSSHAPLHLMISGKRSIPKKYVPQLISILELRSKEGLYFETLVDLHRAKTSQQKGYYLDRLKAIHSKTPPAVHELEGFRFLENPLHTFLLEMTELEDFQNDPAWIQARLRVPTKRTEITDALNRLIELKLLRKDSKGRLARTHEHVTTPPELRDEGTQSYHRAISALASDLISRTPLNEREYGSYSLNIRHSNLPKAKALIREFIRKFIDEIAAPSKRADAVYQLNVQFFGLTQSQGEKS